MIFLFFVVQWGLFLVAIRSLLARAGRLGPLWDEGQSDQDKALSILLTITLLSVPIFSLLDVTDKMPIQLRVVGEALILTAYFIQYLTLKANKWACHQVRLQPDQTLIMSGIYRIVRHPLYAGTILNSVGIVLLFGSWLSLVFIPNVVMLLCLRIGLEEELLSDSFAGYDRYKTKTKHKLCPLIY